jgi:hypothetical protein
MQYVTTPYFHLQAIRRAYRDKGLFTLPKPFTYLLKVNFPTPGNVTPGEQATGRLLIDSDSDFIWYRTSWYAQNAPFDPPGSIATVTEGSSWETQRPAAWEMAIRDLRDNRAWHVEQFIEPILFSGWLGVALAGTPQADSNLEDVTPVAGSDLGMGHFPNALPEPIILGASTLYEFTLRQRATGAVTDSTHLFAFHGARLFKLN